MIKILEEVSLEIPSPTGRLEAFAHLPQETDWAGIICHPHPLYQGTMNNKVVTTTARSFQQLGMASMRFNFRGVGKSTGTYDHGLGETKDLAAIVDFMKTRGYKRFIIAGFSFGSFIAYRYALLHSISGLILIAPPVNHFEYRTQRLPNCPIQILHGEQDELVPLQAVRDWHTLHAPSANLQLFPETTHFFHGKLILLRDRLIEFIESCKEVPS